MNKIFQERLTNEEEIMEILNGLTEISWYGRMVCWNPGHRWIELYYSPCNIGTRYENINVLYIDDEADMEAFIQFIESDIWCM